MTRRPRALTLGIYPSVRGFGWTAFEAPFSVIDWGVVFVAKDKNVRCLNHLERLLDRLEPETVVFEIPRPTERRSKRIVALQKAMEAAASGRGIEIAAYPRGEVQACFASVGARSRHEVALAVASQLPEFRHRLPRRRRDWHPEDRRMALFNAAALVITHYQLGANRFFEDLLGSA